MSISTLQRPQSRMATGAAPETLELTILMPCLNEAETIEVCVDKAMGYLDRSGVAGEVLIADNGSTDGSQAMAEALGARVVAVPEKGYGAALIGGINGRARPLRHHGRRRRQLRFREPGRHGRAPARRRRPGHGQPLQGRHRARAPCPSCTAIWAIRCCPSSAGCSSRIPVGDFHCGLRGFSRESILEPAACRARAWSSPARWW